MPRAHVFLVIGIVTIMDAIIIILLMFAGAYGAASLPFWLPVDDSTNNLLQGLSGGLMLSSVLAVVIPEGFALWFGHDHDGHRDGHDHQGDLGDELSFAYTGLALVVGYLVMVAFDRLNKNRGGACCGQEDGTGSSKAPESAIAGLIIHCVADGIAMGSAFSSGSTSTTLILGAAMVLHKAPMAFGLSSFLISCKWSWQRSQETIVWFSSAAPLSTMLTYVLLSLFRGGARGEGGGISNAIQWRDIPACRDRPHSSQCVVSARVTWGCRRHGHRFRHANPDVHGASPLTGIGLLRGT